MSKKYKLKIWYPTLPIWFEVGFEVIKNNELCCYSNPKYKMRQLSIDEVEYSGKFWELIKEKPLFTTEDGVEIFKGDDYWQVIPEFRHYFIGNNDYERRSCDKHFSTEKAAKDYIEMNKPMYSLKNILDSAVVKYNTGTILLYPYDIKMGK